jgi:hypothetical protein
MKGTGSSALAQAISAHGDFSYSPTHSAIGSPHVSHGDPLSDVPYNEPSKKARKVSSDGLPFRTFR